MNIKEGHSGVWRHTIFITPPNWDLDEANLELLPDIDEMQLPTPLSALPSSPSATLVITDTQGSSWELVPEIDIMKLMVLLGPARMS